MTRALAFFAQLILWGAVALIAATVFARSHDQHRGSMLPRANGLVVDETSSVACKFAGNAAEHGPTLPERSGIKC